MLFILVLFAFSGCNGKRAETRKEAEQVVNKPVAPVAIGTETALLLKDLKENGD